MGYSNTRALPSQPPLKSNTTAIPKIAQLKPIFDTEPKREKIYARNFDHRKQDHKRPPEFL